MGLSFAGIPLCSPTAQVESWIARNFALDDIYQFARTHWHERTNGYYPVHPPEEHRPILLNSLRWPVGASRWAVGHFLVTDNQLARIRPLAYSRPPTAAGGVISTVRYRSLPLVMYDGRNPQTNKIETNLYMLPPRPLAKRAQRNGMYLLTLVDERFFWWSRSAQITVTDTFTTWTQLYTDVATGLGITITPDTIDTAYLRPSPALAQQYRFLPPLLDAVAYNVGHRVVRKLDGTVITQAARTARKQQGETTYTVMAGGEFALTKFPPTDANDAIPQTVAVAFPEFLAGELSSTPRVFAVDLTDIATALPELSGASVTGYTGTKFFRDTAIVCGCEEQGSYSGSLSGTRIPEIIDPECNETEMQLLANQIAEDFYLWQLSGAKDIKYAGVVNRPLEALHDTEWRFRRDECSTRVQLAQPWMDTVTDLSHTSAGGCGGLGPATGTVTGVAEVRCINGWLNVFHRAMTYVGGLLSRVGVPFLSHYAGCCDCGNASSEPVQPPDPPYVPPNPPPVVFTDCCANSISPNLCFWFTTAPNELLVCGPITWNAYKYKWVASRLYTNKQLGFGAGIGSVDLELSCNPLVGFLFSGLDNSTLKIKSCSPFRASFTGKLTWFPSPNDITNNTAVTEKVLGEISDESPFCAGNCSACANPPTWINYAFGYSVTGTFYSGAYTNLSYGSNAVRAFSVGSLVATLTSCEWRSVSRIADWWTDDLVNPDLLQLKVTYASSKWRLDVLVNGVSQGYYQSAALSDCTTAILERITYASTDWPVQVRLTNMSTPCSAGGGGGGGGCSTAATALKSAITYTLTGVTVAAGDLLIITVTYLAVQPPGPNPTGNTCTYNGSAMTLAKREYTHTADTGFVVVEIWYRNVATAQTGSAVVTIPDDIDELAIIGATKVDCLTNNAPVATDSFYASINSTHKAGTLAVVANNYVHAAIVTLDALTADADGTWQNGLVDAGQDRTQNNQLRLCEGMYVATGSESGGQVTCEKTGAATRTYAGVCVAFN